MFPADCRWREGGLRTSRRLLPAPRRSPAWKGGRRHEDHRFALPLPLDLGRSSSPSRRAVNKLDFSACGLQSSYKEIKSHDRQFRRPRPYD